jgi:hypothetical protein
MKVEQAKRLKQLGQENARLKPLVAIGKGKQRVPNPLGWRLIQSAPCHGPLPDSSVTTLASGPGTCAL